MVHVGQRVRVHVNLHKQRLSVVDPTTGTVIQYVQSITLDGVEFRTQAACMRKIRETGRRKVCAYAVGTVVAVDGDVNRDGRVITFNPHRSGDFHYHDSGVAVTVSDRVTFADLRAYEESNA